MPSGVVADRCLCTTDLDDWHNKNEVYVGAQTRGLCNKRRVKALVQYTEEADTRTGNARLVVRIRLSHPRLCEVGYVDRAWEGMHVGVLRALRLVDRLTTREDNIRDAEELVLSLDKF